MDLGVVRGEEEGWRGEKEKRVRIIGRREVILVEKDGWMDLRMFEERAGRGM